VSVMCSNNGTTERRPTPAAAPLWGAIVTSFLSGCPQAKGQAAVTNPTWDIQAGFITAVL